MFEKVIVLILLIGLKPDCKAQSTVPSQAVEVVDDKSKVLQGAFVHSVYFWLVQPDNEVKNKAFETSLFRFLENCKPIKSYHLGRPARTNRPIIDTSYTYALIVTFDSKVEHDLYQEDQLHKTFIKESESLWERVQIYDSVMK